ncbi:MAG: hypothetical protein O3A96_10000 [Proteobacteria bacterium]|nr:hypothetical protein [Pseudomonadota bacterium]
MAPAVTTADHRATRDIAGTGIAAERHFEADLAYNRALEVAEAQAILGWSAVTMFESSGQVRHQLSRRLAVE